MNLNRTEKITICCTMIVAMMFLMVVRKIEEHYSFSMKEACEQDMIAAEVSNLDRGLAAALYKYTAGRSSEEMKDLPQCKDAQ